MKITPVLLGLSLAVAGSIPAAAQDTSTSSIPPVLTITREYVKPYRAGMAHDRTETAFTAAYRKANFPAYYVGLDSLSGRSRALFLTQYASFAEWEKDNKLMEKSPLSTDLERAGLADGDLLDQLDSTVLTYDAELSYHPHADVSHARFYEITVFHVRAGHSKEWQEVSKMYRDLMDQATPSAHWATFDVAYGAEGGSSVSITAIHSMAEIDESQAAFPKVIEAAGGPEGWNKLDELFGAAVDSYRSELFAVNPKQSYVSEDWIKADDFWKAGASRESAAPKPKPAAGGKPGSR